MKTLLIRWYRSLSKVLVGILRQARPVRVSFFVIPPDFDPNRAEAFSERVRTALNEAAVVLMISLGQRTGLFRAMAEHGPGTANQIAIRAGLHERYVREWLAAMVTGRVVEFDLSLQSYRLPAEHARSLSRGALPLGLGWLARLIPILGANEGRIVECFRTGGGVPESEYPDFVEFHEDLQAQLSAAVPETVLPLVPGLDARLRAGIDVLEVGCGGGRVLESLAERYPASRFTGWEESGVPGRGSAAPNVRLHARPYTDPAEPEYDVALTFWSLHTHPDPGRALRVIRGALREGGLYLMQDVRGSSDAHNNVGHPMAPLVYAMSCLHCLGVSLAEGGEGLGAFWGEELSLRMLREAGFDSIDVRQTSSDFTNNYYLAYV